MKSEDDIRLQGRRNFLTRATTMAVAAATATVTGQRALAGERAIATAAPSTPPSSASEPYWGTHQGGIATPAQQHIYFAALDLTTTQRQDVVALMQAWTSAAARLAVGQTAVPVIETSSEPSGDSGEATGLPPERLTVTFGFGPGLFSKDGVDRYGLNQHRPEALIDLPRFSSDQLVPERTGGDLCIQACSNDPQIAFHAVRQLARLAEGTAQIRWVQAGFLPGYGAKETPRNLMGFRDGTMNLKTTDPQMMARHVWVGDEGGWMKNGSYLVARPIRIALEHWDRMKPGFQEQVVGRHKQSGAALGSAHEKDAPNFTATDADGNPVLPENSHTRLAAPASNDGAQILRRGYSYNNGVSFVAERWPPWHQGLEFDGGLLFVCFQRDPRSGFVKVFDKMSKFDMMNQFVTHTGSGLFACPGGATEGGYVGQALLEMA